MERCILDVHAVSSVDEEELFHEVKERLKGKIKASLFNELSQSHKRWCLYWYYTITFFHFGGGPAQELPLPVSSMQSVKGTQMQWESILDFEPKRRDLMRLPTSKHSIKLLGF
jgi:hypothetical protein